MSVSDLEKQCIDHKKKYPQKCAVFIEADKSINMVGQQKYLVPLDSTFKSFTTILRDRFSEYDIEFFINKVSVIDESRLFSNIFDAYAIRDKKGIEPLYLHITIKEKQKEPRSWFSLW